MKTINIKQRMKRQINVPNETIGVYIFPFEIKRVIKSSSVVNVVNLINVEMKIRVLEDLYLNSPHIKERTFIRKMISRLEINSNRITGF